MWQSQERATNGPPAETNNSQKEHAIHQYNNSRVSASMFMCVLNWKIILINDIAKWLNDTYRNLNTKKKKNYSTWKNAPTQRTDTARNQETTDNQNKKKKRSVLQFEVVAEKL